MEKQSRFCFPKSRRLTEKYQFDSIFKYPDYRTSRGSVRAKISANDLGYPRLGIIVAKRQFSRAVARNTVKREIREGFRMACSQLPSVDIVIQIFSFKKRKQFSQSLDGIWQDIMLEQSIQREARENTH